MDWDNSHLELYEPLLDAEVPEEEVREDSSVERTQSPARLHRYLAEEYEITEAELPISSQEEYTIVGELVLKEKVNKRLSVNLKTGEASIERQPQRKLIIQTPTVGRVTRSQGTAMVVPYIMDRPLEYKLRSGDAPRLKKK